MDQASTTGTSRARRVADYLASHRLPIVVFAVAFLVRFVYLVAYRGSPLFQTHVADALYHEEWARRILDGDIFSLKADSVLYKAPLYPYFVALAYLLSGESNFFTMFVQIVLTAASCVLLLSIGRRYFGTVAGAIGAFIYCFYFPSVYFSTEMEIPALAIFLTLLSFHLLVRDGRALSLIAAAITLGLSVLALPSNVLLLPLHVFIAWKQRPEPRSGSRRAVLFAAVALATILPCTLRNLIAGGRATLVSANGGINFYLGNNARYDETVYLPPGYAFDELYNEPRRIAGVDSLADRDRYWYRKAFAFIENHPAQEAALLLKKLVLYFADYEIFRNTDTQFAKASSIYRRIPFVPASFILSAGLAGALLASARRKSFELIAFGVIQALPCLVFFVTDRYRMPSMSVWTLFAGCFAAFVRDAIKSRTWTSGLPMFAAAAGLAVLSHLNLLVVKYPAYRPHVALGMIYAQQGRHDLAREAYARALAILEQSAPRDAKLESEIHARLGHASMEANDPVSAGNSLERAVALDAGSGPAYSYLATLADKQGNAELAAQMYRRAIELNPWDVVSIHNFGLFHFNAGRLDEAIAQFRRVVELAPTYGGAHLDLALAYGRRGDRGLMEAEASTALAHNPRDAAPRYLLAQAFLATGRVDEALAQFQTITKLVPAEAGNAYTEIGIIYAQRRDLPHALESWQKALEVDPGNTSARSNLERARARLH